MNKLTLIRRIFSIGAVALVLGAPAFAAQQEVAPAPITDQDLLGGLKKSFALADVFWGLQRAAAQSPETADAAECRGACSAMDFSNGYSGHGWARY